MRRSFLDDFSKKERLLGFLSDFLGRFSSQKDVRRALPSLFEVISALGT